jgi:predicted secreted protein
MAATAGILNGTDLLVYDGTHAILHSTDCSFQLSQSSRDASTKASAGWKASLYGQRSWTMTNNGLVALDVGYNLAYLLGLITQRTIVTLYAKTANSADFYIYGTALLTSVQMTAPNNNNVTYSASFEGTGALSTITPGSGSGSGGGIADVAQSGNILTVVEETTISGLNGLYIFSSATAMNTHLDHITAIVAPKMSFLNQGAGTVTMDAVDGLLIDGHASITILTGQQIVIFANDTSFAVLGTYGTEE